MTLLTVPFYKTSLALLFAPVCTSLHVRPNSHSCVAHSHVRVLYGCADITGGNIRRVGNDSTESTDESEQRRFSFFPA